MDCAQLAGSSHCSGAGRCDASGMSPKRPARVVTSALALTLALTLTAGGAPATDASAGASHWQWPTSPPGAVVQSFEAPPGPYAAGHRGIDIAATPGTAVLAPADGVVQFAGVVVDRPVVTVRVGDGVLVSMEPVSTELPVGSAVTAGQPFGVVAAGGHCDGRCLHLGVRVNGDYVSPLLFLATVPPAVLLPLR